MARETVYMTIFGTLHNETGKAIRMTVEKVGETTLDSPKSEWFPFSQVQKMVRNPTPGESDELFVSEWILKQKGLI